MEKKLKIYWMVRLMNILKSPKIHLFYLFFNLKMIFFMCKNERLRERKKKEKKEHMNNNEEKLLVL